MGIIHRTLHFRNFNHINHHTTSREENRSRPPGPLYPRNISKMTVRAAHIHAHFFDSRAIKFWCRKNSDY